MNQQERILAALAAGPMTSREVARAARIGLCGVRSVLRQMRRAGLVERELVRASGPHFADTRRAVWRLNQRVNQR